MKIGILTYHNAVNYGAVLQTYALQKALDKLSNVESIVIDYHSPAVDDQYRILGFKKSGSLKNFLLSNITTCLRLRKKKLFKSFVSSKIKCTKPVICVSDDELENIDAVVVGSDQVWNPSCTRGDKTYLLSDISAKTKKISYSASMGSGNKIKEYAIQYGVDYKKHLKDFSHISCREKDATDFLSKELSIHCDTVVDPVLLLNRDDWIDFLKDGYMENKELGDYIFVYNLGNFRTLLNLANTLRNQTGYKVVVVNKDVKGEYMYGKYMHRSNVGPQEFLWLLNNAKYVLSDSFHATAFSILFEKKFYTVGNANSNNTNARMRNILSRYGLEQRYVIDNINDLRFDEELDFTIANKTLITDRKFAQQWLYNAITNKGE